MSSSSVFTAFPLSVAGHTFVLRWCLAKAVRNLKHYGEGVRAAEITISMATHLNSVNDFASYIAEGEKFPSIALSFKPLCPTVLIGHMTVPKRVKFTLACWVYSVIWVIDFIRHNAPSPFAITVVAPSSCATRGRRV